MSRESGIAVINSTLETLLNVLLIEDNPGDARLVKEILLESPGGGFNVEWVPALMPGIARLASGDIDMVLLDLSLPDSQGLDSLTTIRTYAPNVPIVVLTGFDNQDFAQQAVRSGAQDYLIKGELSSSTLARTLRYAVLRQQGRDSSPSAQADKGLGKVIALLGAKGGVGTTSIACHLALELKRQTGGRVLLADLDDAGGSVGFLMKVTSGHTIHEAADNLLRLDQNYWSKIVAHGREGLEIVPSRGALTLEERSDSERIRHVLRFTRSIYQWIVLDLGRASPFGLGLAQELSHVLLTATIDVSALFEVKRLLPGLRDAGVDGKGLCLIVNQVPKHPDILPAEVGRMVGLPVWAALPDSRDELSEAYTSGVLLAEKSNFRRQVAHLARKIAGLDERQTK